jgi:UPF0755 protein
LSRILRAVFLGVAFIALIVACAGYLFLTEIRRPAGPASEPVEIVVEPGEPTSAIATSLREAGLIRQPLLFIWLVRWQDLDGKLQAGRYLLRENMTMGQIISALQNSRVEEIQVRIVEGMRLEQIAEVFASSGLQKVNQQDFLAAVRDGAPFKTQHFFLNSLPTGASLEGYLFPDTYRFAATATVTEVVQTMLDNFDRQYAAIERDVRVRDVKVHQIVTMASIVQREAAQEDEMTKISAVFWNRLKPEHLAETGGGKLGADPTVQYVLGSNTGPSGDWWPNLDTLSNEEINGLSSPYNTRVNPGLPPGPIANPGLAALRAAAQPDESAPYLYFVASCTKPGAHNFATTYVEFQRFETDYLRCKP